MIEAKRAAVMSQTAMSPSTWRPLKGVDARRLSEARLQAHYATQWLARIARGYITPRPDDEHTNLGWDDALDGFVTHPIPDGACVYLTVSDLALGLRDRTVTSEFVLAGRTNAEARRWLGEVLTARRLDANRLDASSPYAMPEHALAANASYDTVGLIDARVELAAWFANARSSVDRVHKQMLGRGLNVGDVRCWPHHLDLATLASFPSRRGELGYVGVGLSPGDGYYEEPYFYVSVYPKPDPATLPELPKPGRWHTFEFTAAVITAHDIIGAGHPSVETDAFLDAAVERAIDLLS